MSLHQNRICTSSVSHTCHMPSPSHWATAEPMSVDSTFCFSGCS
jgi:hypothetical protein